MSIIIQNISTHTQTHGKHKYQVRINNEVICEFTHIREEGLVRCLLKAAKAVEDAEFARTVKFMEALSVKP